MKSNIIYFFRRSLFLLVIAFCYSAFLTLLMMDDDFVMADMIMLFIMGYAIMDMAQHVSFYKSDIPMAVSFGAVRKNVFYGILFYDVINVVLACIVCIMAASVLEPDLLNVRLFMVILAVMAGSNCIGTIMGMLIYKYGKIKAMIFIGVAAAIIGVSAGFMSFFVKAGVIEKAFNDLVFMIIAAALTAVWGVVMFIQKKLIQGYAL